MGESSLRNFLRLAVLAAALVSLTGVTARASDRSVALREVARSDVPVPLVCLEDPHSGVRYIERTFPRRIRVVRARRLVANLRRQLGNLRAQRAGAHLRRRNVLRNRLNRLRAIRQFSRACLRDNFPDLPPPEEEQLPVPEPLEPSPSPEPTPSPQPEPPPVDVGFCDRVEYTFEAPVAEINGSHTIRFSFRDPVPCGQFVDGTWWVQGPVAVRRIEPDFIALVPDNSATYPLPLLETLQQHLNFRVGDPLCAHEPTNPHCISSQEATTVSEFFVSHFGHTSATRSVPHYRNGYAIDPIPDHNVFDSRFAGFQLPTTLMPQYSHTGEEIPDSGEDLILEAATGDAVSLVKIASRYDIRHGTGWSACNVQEPFNASGRGCILSVGILTVVDSPPPQDAFRPPYYGLPFPKLSLDSPERVYFRSSELNLTLLPQLEKASAGNSLPSIDAALKAFAGPWTFLFNNGPGMSLQQANANKRLIGGASHPHYHSSISNIINGAMLRTMHAGDDEQQRRALVEQIAQRGIDYYYGLIAGKTYSSGTGFNLGFKSPILYTGKVLDIPALLAVGEDFGVFGGDTVPNGQPARRYFAEDAQTYFGADTFEGRPIALWAESYSTTPMTAEAVAQMTHEGLPLLDVYPDIVTTGLPAQGGFGGFPNYYTEPYVNRVCGSAGNRTIRDPMGQRDGGYWVAMNLTARPFLADEDERPILDAQGNIQYHCPRLNRVKDVLEGTEVPSASAYQWCCSSAPMVGSYVVAMLLGLREEWNHEPFFNYVERWASPPYSAPGTIQGGYGDGYIRNIYWNEVYQLRD